MRVAIYCRVSTTEQSEEGYSIPAQITTLKQYCVACGYIVQKIYTDAGISGKDIEGRPALIQLIADAKQKEFDCVMVWKLSRLSRNLLDILKTADEFSKVGVSFQSFSEKFDTGTPIGKMLLQLLGSIAEFERNTIIENVKMGMNERFKQGLPKGAIPFGYISENKKPVVVPEQVEIVRYCFEQYDKSVDGNVLTELANYVNKNFTGRSGKLWTRITVRSMLINPFYAGYVRTGYHSRGEAIRENAQILKGSHEPIIDQALYTRVSDRINGRKYRIIRNEDNESILTGLILCPICGSRMYALNTHNSYKQKSGEVVKYPYRVYRCKQVERGRSSCKGFYLTCDKVEEPFLALIKEIAQKANLKSIINNYKKESREKRTEPKPDQLKILKKQLKESESIRDRYYKLFETGKVDMDMFAGKINVILQKVQDIEQQIFEERKKAPDETIDLVFVEAQLQFINRFIDNYNTCSNPDRKLLIRDFVEYVTITTEKTLKSVKFTFGLEIEY